MEGAKIVHHPGYITVTQRTIDMDASMYQIEQNLKQNQGQEVHLIATKCLEVNCSLKWPGTNIFIYAPTVRAVKFALVWDVSAKASLPHNGRADDGLNPGESGRDGKAGQPGDSGGNVHICCNQLEGGENLTIKSVGGKGGDGQDGGHGQMGVDGEDGKVFPKDYLNKCFPPAANVDNQETFAKYIECAKTDTIKNYIIDSRDIYCEFTAKQEERNVTFAVYRNLAGYIGTLTYVRLRQAYCLVRGAQGKVGGDSGDGGHRGPGGFGGNAGDINITKISYCNAPYESHGINIERTKGPNGRRGRDGNKGKCGRGGLQANDFGRMEPDKNVASRVMLNGSLKVQYHPEEPTKKRLPYCPYKKQYAEIYQNNESDRKRQTNGKDGTVRTQSDVRAMVPIPSKPIDARKLVDEYSTK